MRHYTLTRVTEHYSIRMHVQNTNVHTAEGVVLVAPDLTRLTASKD